MPRRPSLLALRAAAWTVAILSVAACTEARKRKPREATPAPSAPAASAPAPATAPVGASAPAAATAPAGETPAPVRRGLDPQRAKGRSSLTLTLQEPLRLGGFEFRATYDPEKFHVAEPVTAPALQGYLCQANLAEPGTIRFNCAGLVNEPRGGLLATFVVSYASAPPTVADFTVSESEVVDDLARTVESARVAVAVEPAAAP